MFKGKTITWYIGLAPGGTYDLFGQWSSATWPGMFHGQPAMVPSNMPVAGSYTSSHPKSAAF
jgi:hypothetical protein